MDICVIVPESKDYWRFKEMRWNWRADRCIDRSVGKRVVFFYYLLFPNIVLLVIVDVLVFGAVNFNLFTISANSGALHL